MAVNVFIWIVFALGLLLCALAAIFGVGEGGAILYRIGAVITILTGVIALAGTAVTDHLNGNHHG